MVSGYPAGLTSSSPLADLAESSPSSSQQRTLESLYNKGIATVSNIAPTVENVLDMTIDEFMEENPAEAITDQVQLNCPRQVTRY